MDGGVVARTKAGCIEGYRSDVVFIPDLQLGVFAAVSSTCDIHGDGDMLAFPVASKLAPAVDAALRQRESTEPVVAPSEPDSLLGTYFCGATDSGVLDLVNVFRNSTSGLVNLAYFDDAYKMALRYVGGEGEGAYTYVMDMM